MDALTTQIVLGAVAAGFIQGLSGFGFGLVAMAFWAWTISPQLAGPMVVFGSFLGQVLTIGSVREAFSLRRTMPFIVGGVIGVPLGVALLPYVNQSVFKLSVGTLLAVWCPTMLLAHELPRVHRWGRVADSGAGFVGGIMGGLGGLTGPAPTLWCTLRGWSKDQQRSVFQAFNLTMHSLTLAAYAASGMITWELASRFAIVAPAMLIPTLVGAKLYAKFDTNTFRRLILTLLFLSGIVLLGSSLHEFISK